MFCNQYDDYTHVLRNKPDIVSMDNKGITYGFQLSQ